MKDFQTRVAELKKGYFVDDETLAKILPSYGPMMNEAIDKAVKLTLEYAHTLRGSRDE